MFSGEQLERLNSETKKNADLVRSKLKCESLVLMFHSGSKGGGASGLDDALRFTVLFSRVLPAMHSDFPADENRASVIHRIQRNQVCSTPLLPRAGLMFAGTHLCSTVLAPGLSPDALLRRHHAAPPRGAGLLQREVQSSHSEAAGDR